jgi:hypothetical protein
MLLSQMAATHALAMDELGWARRAEYLPAHDSRGSMAVKLLRTYVMQVEALAKLKRRGEQVVRVEHVHVHPGGQAIVGAVSTHGAGVGADGKRGQQADGTIDVRAVAFAPGAAVLSEDQSRDARARNPRRRVRNVAGCTAERRGSGAPSGERNGAYRHGLRSRKVIDERRALRALVRAMRAEAARL